MKSVILLLLFCLPFAGVAQDCTATAFEAQDLVGEETTVCGLATQVSSPRNIRGNPVYINMWEKFPNHAFTVVIWGNDVAQFDYDLKELTNKRIAVTGVVADYKGKPQIVVKGPWQVVVVE